LTILCFCFGFAALAWAAIDILLLKNKNQYDTAEFAILSTDNNILFSVGYWKFVWQFFISTI
jgi:hypothetical protein